MKLSSHVRDLNNRVRLFKDCTGLVGGTSAFLDGIPTRATGTITFTIVPAAGKTITLNGTVWTFVTSGATGNQTNLGSLSGTLTQLATDLNASADAQVHKCTYTVSTTVLTVAYNNGDSTANDFTLATNVAGATPMPNLIGGMDYGTATSGGVLCPIIVADVLTFYRLRSGTDATAAPAVIRPTDYLATVNERVWELMTIAGTASTATKTFSATPVFDLNAAVEETMTVTAAITGMSTSNRGDGKKKTIWLVSDGAGAHALAVNASWIPIGSVIDASLVNAKVGILTIHCKGITEASVYYVYKAQP